MISHTILQATHPGYEWGSGNQPLNYTLFSLECNYTEIGGAQIECCSHKQNYYCSAMKWLQIKIHSCYMIKTAFFHIMRRMRWGSKGYQITPIRNQGCGLRD